MWWHYRRPVLYSLITLAVIPALLSLYLGSTTVPLAKALDISTVFLGFASGIQLAVSNTTAL